MFTCRLCHKHLDSNLKSKRYYFCCKQCIKQHSCRIRRQNERKNLPNRLELSMWFDSLLIHDFSCRNCKRKDCSLILDHIISFHNGGKNVLSNIQPLCKVCDKKKKKVEGMLLSGKIEHTKGAATLTRKYQIAHLFEEWRETC